MSADASLGEAGRQSISNAGKIGSAPLAFIGVIYFITFFAAPHLGLVDTPVSFFVKNRLHLNASSTSVFRLIVSIPLLIGFVFGFIRDTWSPFGRGDRAHLVLFSLVTAGVYAAIAFMTPSYPVLATGVLLATVAFQMTNSVANGLSAVLAQERALAGGLSSLTQIAAYLPQILGYLAGGALSAFLEGQEAGAAARILFLCAASLMLILALLGALGPRAAYAGADEARRSRHFATDVRRLLRHRPLYPVMVMQLLWQFSPSTGTVLQYHLADALHASDAVWGEWNAIFLAAFIPGFLVYALLCRRVRLSWLLWVGFGVAVAQMTPFLFIKTAREALIAAAALGFLGAFAQGALMDLAFRSAPKGLEATLVMMFLACYWIAFRFGDLFGTALYDHFGFFVPVMATILTTAAVLLVIPFIPPALIATRDGEALSLEG